jgi:CRP-like cAMP-binding protein
VLFRQGHKVEPGAGALYCLVKGRLKVSSLREDGKEAILECWSLVATCGVTLPIYTAP